ncbi:polysaccharide deacetylase family protein [Pajaroellobacter abortibovis]|uniref:NodB homology domain-containing protein n=1 Tax=Pajaroellobacter abortibovis TaxID=1882918 RepID=A0A1L6MY24_9BACT|nr:polysaccharide deacetylase family protein [Pajaroellobacter abortibovis]APS00386.1 hypothetical protein BCY86_06620 [Pajaroellobacter abortibovis]
MRLCAVGIDLDEIVHYEGIHGIPSCEEFNAHAVYEKGLMRWRALAEELDIPCTFFAVGANLTLDKNAMAIRLAHEEGHEIANHTLDHLYCLTRLSREEVLAQIRGGSSAIEQVIGERPVGFRSPGYTITDSVYRVLEDEGLLYDSSVFPCPSYYGVKAAVLGWMKLRGRLSRTILDTPFVLCSPRRPYRVGKPYWKRGDGILELPIQVTPFLRLPYFGTSLVLGGPKIGKNVAGLLTSMCLGEPVINLEFHGIDLLDQSDGLKSLASYQPDLRIDWQLKRQIFKETFHRIQKSGYTFLPLRGVAHRLCEEKQ